MLNKGTIIYLHKALNTKFEKLIIDTYKTQIVMKPIKTDENIISFIPGVISTQLSITLEWLAEIILKTRINRFESKIDDLVRKNIAFKSDKIELQNQLDSYGLNSDRIENIYKNSIECHLVFNKKTNEPMILSQVYSKLNNILYNIDRLFSIDTKPVASIDFSYSYEELDCLIVNNKDDYNKGYASCLLEFYFKLASSQQVKEISGKLPADTDKEKYKHLHHFYSKHGFEVEDYSPTKHIYIHKQLSLDTLS